MSLGNRNTAALLQQKWAHNKVLQRQAVTQVVESLCAAVEAADDAEKDRLDQYRRSYGDKDALDASVKIYYNLSNHT